jgi:hypothetical protein
MEVMKTEYLVWVSHPTDKPSALAHGTISSRSGLKKKEKKKKRGKKKSRRRESEIDRILYGLGFVF